MTRAATGLLDATGHPLVPSSVVAELREINPRLGMQYHEGLHAFVVTLQWPEDDARRALIQSGDLAPNSDFEILCPVPAHVSLDELRGWLERQLRRVGESRDDVRRMVAANEERVAKQNAALRESVENAATEELIESVTKPSSVGSRRKRVR